ncbi:MAG: iron ABC transporter permease [Candidatus Lokiarchaeota archaeon]|nr:iron ABC transporter permease [Candidatus Lokiarchaeota archaeon]
MGGQQNDVLARSELSRQDLEPPRLGLQLRIEKYFSKNKFRVALDAGTISFFLFLIIGPLVSLVGTVFLSWNSIYTSVFADPITEDVQWEIMGTVLGRSFEIAAIATCIDLVLGLPMALILTRYEFKGKKVLDTLVDLPMAVPTSALGFSLYLFWGSNMGIGGLLGLDSGILSPGPILITLTHVAFTYPFIVRNLKVIFQEQSKLYEDAAKTLGASGFTVFRTITAPLAKEGIIAGIILAFTRSLGETGATIIVAGIFETAPMYVVALKDSLNFPSAAFLSMILILVSLVALMFLRIFSRRIGFPVSKVVPKVEHALSKKPARVARNALGMILFIIIVLIPAMYTIPYVIEWFVVNPFTGSGSNTVLESLFQPDNKWAWLWTSTGNSIAIAGISTVICLLFGLPMAMILVKRKWGKVKELLDALIDVPLIAPTAALGFAMYLFWGPFGLNVFQPGFWLIIMVHVAMCFPYIVRPIIAIIEKTNPELESAARTLGASSLTTFRTITLPKMKPGIIAGMIMSFTRSMGETGATIVVSGLIRTVPLLIVDWVETRDLAAAGFASLLLIIFSFIVLLLLRKTMERS